MQFNSTVYFGFLVLVVVLFHQLRSRDRRILLLLASYAFYGFWSVPYSLLLLLSTIVDYSAARTIESTDRTGLRRLALFGSMAANLGLLCFFKYANFLSDSSATLLGLRPWPVLDLILPLGISFYTFQTMSYTIDVYRGVFRARRSIVDVALYVSFFPQLVAGPIVRAGELIPQLACTERPVDWILLRRGVALILWGMFKKVYIADSMALIVDEAYGSPELVGGRDLILASYGFCVQIYCDFSGYVDIALGSALLLGIRLPENFRSPLLSCSMTEFWQRWHITLSTWLRDYVYISMGGNRRGRIRTYVHVMLTLVLGGLWHGAMWNLVAWGAIHGGVLCLERLIGLSDKPRSRIGAVARWVITFHIFIFTLIVFRSQGLPEVALILGRCVTLADGLHTVGIRPMVYLALILLFELLHVRRRWLTIAESNPAILRWTVYVSVVVLVITFKGATNPEFIYFQF